MTTTLPLRVGLVGCGVISDTYVRRSAGFDGFDIVACADADAARANERASDHGITAAPFDELLTDPAIDCILDLTPPAAHFDVARAALRAGKHVYQEKPLAIELHEAQTLLREADAAGVRLGCAPDTFLGAGLQTVRAVLDEGRLGEPVGCAVAMVDGGPEHWHPDPEFFYARGGGPLFDVGPYLVTTAVALLGPVRSVTAFTRRLRDERVVGSGPRQGQHFPVEVDTTVMALLEHGDGPITSLATSFDIPGRACPFELHGTLASVEGPDPNAFGGPVRIREGQETVEVPLLPGADDEARGIGLDDMAHALVEGRPERASGALAAHVLEVLHAVLESARSGRHVEIASTVERPEPLPV